MKILLVDDSRVALMLEQRLLDRSGMQVLTCTNGADAVVTAIEEQPDLIIMDVCMPRMNGIEATQHLRKRAATRHIPILLMSTNATPAQERAYRAAGCNAFLSKPVDGAKLRRAVDDCLSGRAYSRPQFAWVPSQTEPPAPMLRPSWMAVGEH